MMMRRLATTMALLMAIGFAASASTIKLSLTLEPAKTLPAIPVTFRIEAMNSGSARVAFPCCLVLQVTPENGEAFVTVAGPPRSEQRVVQLSFTDADRVWLGPGERKRLDMWAGPESPPWYAGRFWLEPGQYRLQLIADDGFRKSLLTDKALTLNEPFLIDPVASNATPLTIEMPKGADAEVWGLIKADGSWMWPDHLADKIWQLYPNSDYAAYAVRVDASRDPARQIQYYASALAKKPRGAFPDYYRLSIAQHHLDLMELAVDTDIPGAFRESEAARGLLEEILDDDTDSAAKVEAREVLKRVKTMQQIVEYNARIRHIQVQRKKLVPLLDCVSKEGTAFRAKFGFDNGNDYPVELEIGDSNQFLPLPADRGQPTTFPPGHNENAFKINSSEPRLTWTLDGNSVTFPKDGTKKCEDDQHD
jgi:hypothetical protein